VQCNAVKGSALSRPQPVPIWPRFHAPCIRLYRDVLYRTIFGRTAVSYCIVSFRTALYRPRGANAYAAHTRAPSLPSQPLTHTRTYVGVVARAADRRDREHAERADRDDWEHTESANRDDREHVERNHPLKCIASGSGIALHCIRLWHCIALRWGTHSLRNNCKRIHYNLIPHVRALALRCMVWYGMVWYCIALHCI
jgi:hypothetical protein